MLKEWKITKKWLVFLGTIAATLRIQGAEVEWLTDVHAALDKARLENKFVLLDFTGSDWCGWCQRLKSEVFDQPEFAAFAQVNLVMVEVDFPHHKPQSPEQKAANDQLAGTYHITGFPTLIYLNQFSQQVAIGGYIAGGPKSFIAQVEKFPALNIGMAPASPKDLRNLTPLPALRQPSYPLLPPLPPATPNLR